MASNKLREGKVLELLSGYATAVCACVCACVRVYACMRVRVCVCVCVCVSVRELVSVFMRKAIFVLLTYIALFPGFGHWDSFPLSHNKYVVTAFITRAPACCENKIVKIVFQLAIHDGHFMHTPWLSDKHTGSCCSFIQHI